MRNSDFRVVNVFWMCQAVKRGQRPGAVTGMDKMCFKRVKVSSRQLMEGPILLQSYGSCSNIAKRLFSNSEGSKIGNATINIKQVLLRYGIMDQPLAEES